MEEVLIDDNMVFDIDNLKGFLNDTSSFRKTILLASHNREDIAALCDTTVEIDRGKIVG